MSDVKLLAVYDQLEGKIRRLQKELERTQKMEGPQGVPGERGLQGPVGKEGARGKDGVNGLDGRDGKDGRDGSDGSDGVSITDVDLDFDNHLRVSLSDGRVIDAGEIAIPEGVTQEAVQQIVHAGGGHVGDRIYIQDTQPTEGGTYLWIQTNVNSNGDFTFWFTDRC